jgi:hypothetical protein
MRECTASKALAKRAAAMFAGRGFFDDDLGRADS